MAQFEHILQMEVDEVYEMVPVVLIRYVGASQTLTSRTLRWVMLGASRVTRFFQNEITRSFGQHFRADVGDWCVVGDMIDQFFLSTG